MLRLWSSLRYSSIQNPTDFLLDFQILKYLVVLLILVFQILQVNLITRLESLSLSAYFRVVCFLELLQFVD